MDIRQILRLVESASNTDLSEAKHHMADFDSWFAGSKVVDSHGNPLPVYHGTARPDRVGNKFRKSRATAGPMAYFTDTGEIAGNYAMNKTDTSISDEENDWKNWFLVKLPGYRKPLPVIQAWYALPSSERAEIAKNAPKIRHDYDDGEKIVIADDNDVGVGNYQWEIKQVRGNCIAALFSGWVEGGTLFGEEEKFIEVLKLAGLKQPIIFADPNAKTPFVYRVYLSIKHPLVTNAIPNDVIDSLIKTGSRKRDTKKENELSMSWDKKRISARQWLRSLLDDVEKKTTFSWTIIPDWVTNTLEAFGYDGIQDAGGKNGGDTHTVWIPFHEDQVRMVSSREV